MHGEKKVSTTSQAVLWFGAAVSIAEILTGAWIAPLGLEDGLAAILLGHIIGACLLFPAAYIGAQSGLASAQSARLSFGRYGSYAFSLLNITQLVGWTTVMILTAAQALSGITDSLWSYRNFPLCCILIGSLIALWVVFDFKRLAKANGAIVSLLFILSLVLAYIVLSGGQLTAVSEESMPFGVAVELNVAMSLSWLPLIADYTRHLEHPKSGTFCSVLGYASGSMLMFSIGLISALFAGTSDISAILLTAGLGVAALFIVLFSTVTTTYLDVYSAGVSAENLHARLGEKSVALAVCALGTLLAVCVPMTQYENFLLYIGSVFAPLFAILFVDYAFLGRRTEDPQNLWDVPNIVLWVIGFIFYRRLLNDTQPLIWGITMPVMLAIGGLRLVVGLVLKKKQSVSNA